MPKPEKPEIPEIPVKPVGLPVSKLNPPSPRKPDIIESVLENARKSPDFEKFSDEQKDIAIEMVKKMFERFPNLDFPHHNADGSIEMTLMDGSKIHIASPNGGHLMNAEAEMDLAGEKGDKETMLHYYIMASCSNIDGEPVSIFDLKDRLSARDFKALTSFFRTANLL